jgi:hypothetical protein
MEQKLREERSIIGRWRREQFSGPTSVELELDRTTSPQAPMSLILRFATEAGPRSVIASGVPLGVASEIVREMARAGHYAEFVDQYLTVPMTDRIKRCKTDLAPLTKQGEAVRLKISSL